MIYNIFDNKHHIIILKIKDNSHNHNKTEMNDAKKKENIRIKSVGWENILQSI